MRPPGEAGEVGLDPGVVEPHAVDDRPVRPQSEQPRPRIARLRAWGDRPGLDEAEPQAHERGHRHRVLVEPGGQADRIGEASPQRVDRQRVDVRVARPPSQTEAQRAQGQFMRALRIDPTHERHEGGCDRGRHGANAVMPAGAPRWKTRQSRFTWCGSIP